MSSRRGRRLGWAAIAAGLAGIAGLAAPPAAFAVVPPDASLTASPNPAVVGETVTFDGSGSSPGLGATIETYEWDLDGDSDFETNTGSTPTASRSYADPGTIPVTLLVTDSDGDSDDETINLEIQEPPPAPNEPPTAGFIYEPSTPAVGEQVTFASTSKDPEGPIADDRHFWDLDGDGEFDDAVGQTITHAFPTAGQKAVSLAVVDADGAAAQATRVVIVGETDELDGLLSPFPIVRLSGRLMPNGSTKIKRLSVRAPGGSSVHLRCRGGSCPFGERNREVKRRRVSFPGIERRLRPGVVIKVFVTKPEMVGKFTRFKLRAGKAPKRKDRCVAAGSRKRIRCPES